MRKISSKERFATLTKREKEVLRLVLENYHYSEVAEKLLVSENTVKSHMKKIYEKLGLYHLSRAERVRNLFERYKPMFADEPESRNYPRRKNPPRKPFHKRVIANKEIEEKNFTDSDDENVREEMFENPDGITIEIEPEPEELTQEDEAILNEDESALVAYTINEYNLTGGKPMQTKKKFSWIRLILNLIILGFATYGAWQGWQTIRDAEFLNLFNPNYRATQVNQGETSGTGGLTNSSDEAQTSAVEVGEWVEQDGVALQLKQWEIDRDLLELKFEFWNKSDGQLMFKWQDKVNFSMTDNLGNTYRVAVSDMGEQQEVFNAGERQLLQERLNTVEFYTDYLYDRGVTDLYITVEYLSRIEKAVFHIGINK